MSAALSPEAGGEGNVMSSPQVFRLLFSVAGGRFFPGRRNLFLYDFLSDKFFILYHYERYLFFIELSFPAEVQDVHVEE